MLKNVFKGIQIMSLFLCFRQRLNQNMVYFDVNQRILQFMNILQTTYKYRASNRFDFELQLLKLRLYVSWKPAMSHIIIVL